jgi:hypothetical protein
MNKLHPIGSNGNSKINAAMDQSLEASGAGIQIQLLKKFVYTSTQLADTGKAFSTIKAQVVFDLFLLQNRCLLRHIDFIYNGFISRLSSSTDTYLKSFVLQPPE